MRTWLYLINPFLSKNISFRKLYAVAQYLKSRLMNRQSDPVLAQLHEDFLIPYDAYVVEYNKSAESRDTSKSETMRFNLELDKLPAKLRNWENRIAIVFDETTPEYLRLFPGGRSKIYTGSLIDQFTKLQNLAAKLADYSSLATVQTEVDTYCQGLMLLQVSKDENISGIGTASAELKSAFTTLGRMMFIVLCKLIVKYIDDTTQVEYFFPMHLLRSKPAGEPEEEIYKLPVPPASIQDADLGFSVDDVFMVRNTGEAPLECWGAVTTISPKPEITIAIAPGEEVEITATQLGAPDAKYMLFGNSDAALEGEVEIVQV
jgi:hypothetical protein